MPLELGMVARGQECFYNERALLYGLVGMGGVMAEWWWVVLPIGLGMWAGLRWAWPRVHSQLPQHRLAEIRRQFHQQRERLEMKFLCLASRSSLGSGPHWLDCEFEDEVAYVRNRKTGQLCALVGVFLVKRNRFDPLEPSNRCRVGTAIFRFSRSRWDTDGRAVLNLTPAETIRFYQDALELLDREPVREH